jgi:hypothetical protein
MTIDATAIILCISGIVNLVLIWYIIQLLKRFLNFQEQLDAFVEKIREYEDHIEKVYNMETFYGDPTLSSLLKHSKDISEECEDFRIFYLGNERDIEEEEEDEDAYPDVA